MMPFSPKLPVPSSMRPWGLSKEHRITLNGLDLVPDLSGALFVPEFKALLVADLHLEKASNNVQPMPYNHYIRRIHLATRAERAVALCLSH